jgi:hypothetical protein
MGTPYSHLALAMLLGCSSLSCKRIEPVSGEEVQSEAALLQRSASNPAVQAKEHNEKSALKRIPLGKGVWLETNKEKRRVLVEASVCLREGDYGLECLLCRTGTKEHESVLHTSADAGLIHAGLLAAGAQPGSPVQYKESGKEYIITPPSGQPISVMLQFEENGRRISVPAQEWVRNGKSGKPMKDDWVFAGSRLWRDSQTGHSVYGATAEGGYICTSNVPTALLDLPFNSPKSLEGRSFEPFTEHIPPLDTQVLLMLEPKPRQP